eukprot:Rmarinus@m.9193
MKQRPGRRTTDATWARSTATNMSTILTKRPPCPPREVKVICIAISLPLTATTTTTATVMATVMEMAWTTVADMLVKGSRGSKSWHRLATATASQESPRGDRGQPWPPSGGLTPLP